MITINGKELKQDITFSGGELQIRLPDLDTTSEVVVDTRLRSSEDIMRLLLVCNAIYEKRFYYGDTSDTIVKIWYLPYARQDRVCSPGEALSRDVILGVLELLPVKTIWVADLHSRITWKPAIIKEKTCLDIFKENEYLLDRVDVLVSPDKGASSKTKSIGDYFNLPVIYCNNIRNLDTGYIYKYSIDFDNLPETVLKPNDTLLVIDDIYDGGLTFELLSQSIKRELYTSLNLRLFVTHGIFSKGVSKVKNSGYSKIYTTDSFSSSLLTKDYELLDKVIKL